jgi:5-carboxymethyl-2-hydroxymuconate isomerase
MPQITVEYSASLSDAFDRRGFALALHPMAAELINADLDNFKTRFYRIEEGVIGDGSPAKAMIHVDLAILPGRSPGLKSELGRAALDLACRHVTDPSGVSIQTTVEVRDLDRTNYHKRITE